MKVEDMSFEDLSKLVERAGWKIKRYGGNIIYHPSRYTGPPYVMEDTIDKRKVKIILDVIVRDKKKWG